VARYRARISGPLLDRIDLHVAVPALPSHDLASIEPGESSAVVGPRVVAARERQLARQACTNSRLGSHVVDSRARLTGEARAFLRDASASMMLSARGHHRVIKVARTIADLEPCEDVLPGHVAEALCYRSEGRPP
jgi:magnesium chelatase family protein